MSKILPNTFQVPNYYADHLLPLLTPSEQVVLVYACRRIFGFPERGWQDRIPVRQFAYGLPGKDLGTGLGVKAVRAAIHSLEALGILIRLEPEEPREMRPALWTLQTDETVIDHAALAERQEAFHRRDAGKMEIARSARKGNAITPGLCNNPRVVQQPHPQGSATTPPPGVVQQPPLHERQKRKPVRKPDHACADDAEVEAVLDAYPKRAGAQEKAQGRVKLARLLAAGEDGGAILAGVERYARYVEAKGDTGTEFVRQITRFLNGRSWEEAWEIVPFDVMANGRRVPKAPSLAEQKAALMQELRDRDAERADAGCGVRGFAFDEPDDGEPAASD